MMIGSSSTITVGKIRTRFFPIIWGRVRIYRLWGSHQQKSRRSCIYGIFVVIYKKFWLEMSVEFYIMLERWTLYIIIQMTAVMSEAVRKLTARLLKQIKNRLFFITVVLTRTVKSLKWTITGWLIWTIFGTEDIPIFQKFNLTIKTAVTKSVTMLWQRFCLKYI